MSIQQAVCGAFGLVALVLSSCKPAVPTTSPSSPESVPSQPKAEADDPVRTPTRDEVLIYLTGKELDLDLHMAATKEPHPKSIKFEKDKIVNLTIRPGKIQLADTNSYFGNELSFLYTEGNKKYLVDAYITHKMVGDQRAYYSLSFRTVVMQ